MNAMAIAVITAEISRIVLGWSAAYLIATSVAFETAEGDFRLAICGFPSITQSHPDEIGQFLGSCS